MTYWCELISARRPHGLAAGFLAEARVMRGLEMLATGVFGTLLRAFEAVGVFIGDVPFASAAATSVTFCGRWQHELLSGSD